MTITDPGPEVVDLPDKLRPTVDELDALADLDGKVDAAEVAGSLEKRTGFATDYQWCTWLADVLRAAGCSVVEHPGWQRRGRPRSVGPFEPVGVIWHHDASAPGPSPGLATFIAEVGRPSEGIPAPLSQAWVCMGCNGRHPVGTWHVLAAGRANHAGEGQGWGLIGRDLGTASTIGVETDNTTGERTPAAMYVSLLNGTAAILRRLGARSADDVAARFCAHKEYAKGRKIDPDDVDMPEARRDVAVLVTGQKPHRDDLRAFPGAPHFEVGQTCPHGHVAALKVWLNEIHGNGGTQLAGDRFTAATRKRVEAFQRATPDLAGDPDGIPGPQTWRRLQLAAREATRETR